MVEPRFFLRLLCYGLGAAGLAFCSTAPRYEQLPANHALLRLSMTIAGAPLQGCRELTPGEIAKLAANMRLAEHCPRGRSQVHVRLMVDDIALVDEVIAPPGIAGDGPARIYRRIVLPAGAHRIHAAVNEDTRQPEFRYVAQATRDLAAGRVVTVDFDREAGGVIFR